MPNSVASSLLMLTVAAVLGAPPEVATAQTAFGQQMPPVPSPPSAPVPTGPPVSLTLHETVAIGLRDNRSIKSAYLQRVVEKFSLIVIQTRFLPKARISAAATQSDPEEFDTTRAGSADADVSWLLPTGGSLSFAWGRMQPLDAPNEEWRQSTTLSLSQPLLRGAGLDINMAPLRFAKMQEEINHLSLKNFVSATVSSIVVSYRTLLAAQEQVRLAELSLERARGLLETNRALIDAGRMAAADIVQTESSVANQEFNVLRTRQSLQDSQLALLRLLALDPRTNIVASDQIQVERVQIDYNQVRDLALSNRMDLIGQRLALEQAKQSLRVAKNNRLWDLSVTASVTKREEMDPLLGRLDPRTDTVVGLRLGIPIGDFQPQLAELQAETQLRDAELRYEDLLQVVESQILDSVQMVETSWLQLEAARRARSHAARALELQQEKLKAGRASNFEVLSFQDALRQADAQELSAGIAYLNTLTSLDQQIGSTLETWRINLND